MHNKILMRIIVGCVLLGSHEAMSAPPDNNASVSEVDRFNVSGDERWDLLAVDTKRHRLFVSRSSHVQIIDTESRKIVGDIPDTDGVHGIALADDLNVGFTSNGKSNSITIFDLSSFNVIEIVKISGVNPDAILYEPKSKHVFSFNGRSDTASIVDARSHKEIAAIRLPGKPELAVSDNAGNVFVNIEDKNEIVVIDTRSNKILKHYPMGHGVEPTGLAIDQMHHRLFSVCANQKMEILDSETGRVISEVAIGIGPDSAAFDAELGIAFSSNGDGTLTMVKENDPEHFSIARNINTQTGARTMAYDPVNHLAYLVTASFGETPLVTKEQPKPRPAIIPNSFLVLVVSVKP